MTRYAIGVTLTNEERAMMRTAARGARSQPVGRLFCHEATALLPDGTSCKVSYRRFGARSHRFTFEEPLREAVWLLELLDDTKPTIERQAQDLAPQAFAQAIETEQRQMRCKSVPKGSTLPPGAAQMTAKSAELIAGHYTVCIRSSSGRLAAVGTAQPQFEAVAAELREGQFANVRLLPEERLVIGIGCRHLRRWVEPRFLPFSRDTDAPASVVASEN